MVITVLIQNFVWKLEKVLDCGYTVSHNTLRLIIKTVAINARSELIYMRVGYVFDSRFLAGMIQPISTILAALIKNGRI